MARKLRANTATIVTVGPFYDKGDGVVIENALTITNERITFVVDNNDGSAPTLVLDNVTGATSGTDNDLNYITNCDAGLMQLELSAANTNHAGKRAFLTITDAANHVPVFHEFMIQVANVFDAQVGTDFLQVDAVELSGDATAADNAEAFFDGTGYAGTNNVMPTTTAVTNMVTANVTQISGDAPAADNLEAACDGTGYNVGAGSVVAASVTGAVGSVTGAVGSVTGAVGSVTGAVGSVTGSVGSVAGHTAQTGDSFAIVNGASGLVAVKGVADAVQAKTDSLTFTVAGDVDCNVQTWKGEAAPTLNNIAAADVWTATNATLSLAYGVLAEREYRFLMNDMKITNETGNMILYAEDGVTQIASSAAWVTDNDTLTTRVDVTWGGA